MSTAIERALEVYEPDIAALVPGRRVFIDTSKMDGLKIPYSESALKNLCLRHGAVVAPKDQAELLLEVRTGSVGIVDKEFGVGIPELPFPIPNTALNTLTPSLYVFKRDRQEGWAKYIIVVLDAASGSYVSESDELWGTSYYSQWTLFGLGPFDLSNDIYPGVFEEGDETAGPKPPAPRVRADRRRPPGPPR